MTLPALPALGSTDWYAWAQGLDSSARGDGINALNAGVVADGTTDDTAAWAALLAARQPGDRVVLPPGRTSVISASITPPSSATGMVISGWGATLKLVTSTSGVAAIDLGASNVSLIGLTVDASSSPNSICVRPRTGALLNGCRFINAAAAGVYLGSTYSDIRIEGNIFSGGGYGVLFDTAYSGARVAIHGNTFLGTASGDAIEVNTPTNGCSQITVTGNTVSGYTNTAASGIGIGLARVTGAAIIGNTIDGCGLDGIHVENSSSDLTIVGNRVSNCARSGISLQIGAGTGAAPGNSTIAGNTVTGCATSTGSGGIALEGATALANVAITSNIVRGCGRAGAVVYGIDLGSGGTGHVVVGNTVSNTTGSTSAGIRWNAGTELVVSNNRCFDDQGTKTQQYGMRVGGINTNVLVMGNQLVGNLTAPFEEASLSGGSPSYVKRYNRPSGSDTPVVAPVSSGAVTDTSFGPVSPLNGSLAIDQTNGRLYLKYNNAWHYISITA